jgi:hypothetical protein
MIDKDTDKLKIKKEELEKLEEEIKKKKWTGMVSKFYIDGGFQGYNLSKRDKILEEEIKQK